MTNIGKLSKEKEIVENLYKRFGTDSGILFGIKERAVVEMLVNMIVEQSQQMNGSVPEGEEYWKEKFNKWCEDYHVLHGRIAISLKSQPSIQWPSEEEIKKQSELEYPLDDPKKNMFHDNTGQYTRRQAFLDAITWIQERLQPSNMKEIKH
jgi:hypothetical protein